MTPAASRDDLKIVLYLLETNPKDKKTPQDDLQIVSTTACFLQCDCVVNIN